MSLTIRRALAATAALAIGAAGFAARAEPASGSGVSTPVPIETSLPPSVTTPIRDDTTGSPTSSVGKTCDGRSATIVGPEDGGHIEGTPGDDVIVGSYYDDVVNGRGGQDVVCLLHGDDRFSGGGSGPDRIFTGHGRDFIAPDLGGSYIYSKPDEVVFADTVSYAHYTDPVHVNLGEGWARLGFSGERDTLIEVENVIGGSGNDLLVGNGRSMVDGGPGGDLVAAGAGANASTFGSILRGGPGSDYIVGGSGQDWLFGDERQGEQGNDTILGNGGDDKLHGRGGDDWLRGGEGNDDLDGGGDDDILQGGSGNDELMGGDGVNDLLGGSGHDLFINDVGDDTIVGDSGEDTVDHRLAAQGLTIDLRQVEITALGTDTFVEIEIVIGSRWSDVMIGDDNANDLRGGSGADSISGGGGDDTLQGGWSSDRLLGGPGNDRLWGESRGSTRNETGAVDICDGGPGPDDRAFGCERAANIVTPL